MDPSEPFFNFEVISYLCKSEFICGQAFPIFVS